MKITQALIFGFILFSGELFAAENTQNSQSDEIIKCRGQYALCIAQDCPKNDDGTQAMCRCPVYMGSQWGLTTCASRASAPANQVYSEYSPRFLLPDPTSGAAAKKAFDPVSFCDEGSSTTNQYVNCLDVLCTLDGDGKNATCPCPVVNTSATDPGYLIEAANCTEAAAKCQKFSPSSSPIAPNSAPVIFSSKIVTTSLTYYGKHMDDSMSCISKKTAKDLLQSGALKDDADKNMADHGNDDPHDNTQDRADDPVTVPSTMPKTKSLD